MSDRNTRVPPNDLGAERALLGCALMDPEIFDVVGPLIEPDDFYSESHQAIWAAMVALMARGRPIDTVTLRDELERSRQLTRVGGDEYLLSLTNTIPTVRNAEAYSKSIVDHSRVRRVIAVAHRIAADGYAPIEKVSDFIESAESAIYDAAKPRDSANNGALLPDVVRDVYAKLVHARDNHTELMGMPTGFTKLDKLTTGWHPGDLIIVAGRPGSGKSAVAFAFLEYCAMLGAVVAGFSLEMLAPQWALRGMSSRARVDGTAMRLAQMSDYDWTKLAGAVTDLQKLTNFHLDDTPALHIKALPGKLRRIRKQHGRLDLVVIDYLQLMRGSKTDSREQEIGEISRTLKQLAKDMGVPIIALAQLNRDIEKRVGGRQRPQLSDLRESGAIEQDADTVIFVHRPEMYDKDNVALQGIAELIIGKQRSGATGVVRTKFFNKFTRFENLEEFEQDGFDL
jgi:replicative DNA helicase